MRKWCCQQFQRWVSYQTSLTGNGALHIRRTLVDYSWCTEPYPPFEGGMNLSRVNSLICIPIYCSENFGNLFIFEFAGKGFFIMVWCPKLAFESAKKVFSYLWRKHSWKNIQNGIYQLKKKLKSGWNKSPYLRM